jgi:hypothetical protein
VAAVDTHYEFLGLEPTASQAAIEAAIDKVSEQAIALVYSSPQRSSDLWERIRHMRRDLLATQEGRQVYDEALRRSNEMAGASRATASHVGPMFRPPEVAVDVPSAGESRPPRGFVAPVRQDDEASRGRAWPYALIAAAAVFVAVVGALVARAPGVSPPRRPVAMTLSQLGAVRGSKFASGGAITLTWTKVPNASMYRVQVATSPGDPSDAVVFAHGGRTISVATTAYRLKVTGSQLYYWRVQARVGNKWQPYTPSQHFAVAKPDVSKPLALAPITGSAKGGNNVRLCWSAVPHAIGYRLRVQGQRTRTVSGTCVTLSVRPRTYRWSVAALVRGAGLYTGAYSVAAVLRVQPDRHSLRKSTGTRHSVRHVTNSRAVTTRSKAATKPRATTAPVEVAFAASRPSSSSVTRAVLRLGIATNRSRTTASRRSTLGVTPIRSSAVTPRRTATRAAGSAPARFVPRPPSTPSKKHTPATGSTPRPTRLPLPPAPPTSPSPTRSVSPAKTTTPSSPISVRPIVAAQIPARTAASPTSTRPTVSSTSSSSITYSVHQPSPTSSSPSAGPTSPLPTKTVPTVASPTPEHSGSHSEHPDHPAHPAHPVHPTHP